VFVIGDSYPASVPGVAVVAKAAKPYTTKWKNKVSLGEILILEKK
jgi:hypothetical protein